MCWGTGNLSKGNVTYVDHMSSPEAIEDSQTVVYVVIYRPRNLLGDVKLHIVHWSIGKILSYKLQTFKGNTWSCQIDVLSWCSSTNSKTWKIDTSNWKLILKCTHPFENSRYRIKSGYLNNWEQNLCLENQIS